MGGGRGVIVEMGCLLLRVPGPHTNRVVWKDSIEKAATGAISLRSFRPGS